MVTALTLATGTIAVASSSINLISKRVSAKENLLLTIHFNLCWIAKACVEIKSNRLKNVLTHHKLIEYLPSRVSDHSRVAKG